MSKRVTAPMPMNMGKTNKTGSVSGTNTTNTVTKTKTATKAANKTTTKTTNKTTANTSTKAATKPPTKPPTKSVTPKNISKLWTDSGFLSLEKFKKYLKKNKYEFKVKDVKEFITNKSSVQVTKKIVRPKEFDSIYAKSIRDNYQVDLMIYDRYEINNYKYVFGCIDVKSRYAYCIPMTNKKGSTILKCFKEAFKVMGKPKRINFDNEFKSNELVKYLQENNIETYYSYTDEAYDSLKNAIIERFWRTLANLLQAYRQNTQDRKWYNYLKRVVTSYNNTEHGTTKEEPVSIWSGKEKSKQIFNSVEEKMVNQKGEYINPKIGDVVRIALKKSGTFAKSDELSYSTALYKIMKKDTKLSNRYILENIQSKALTRPHMPRDLMKVNQSTLDDVTSKTATKTRSKVKDTADNSTKAVKARKRTKKALKELE